MKNQIFISLIIISNLLFSCASSNKEYEEPNSAGVALTEDIDFIGITKAENDNLNDEAASETLNNSDVTKIVERKLIKTGDVSFETENLAQTQLNILNAVKSLDGYISSDNEYRSYYQMNHTLTIRVPADNFDKLISIISEGVENFDNKSIDVQDVTEEYIDIVARLKNKKELETRYLQLLSKANTVTELLEIEREIGNLRAEIESIEGRLNSLKNRISLSTLTVNFYKEIPNKTAFGEKMADGISNGWNNLMWFFIGIINIWPFVLIFIGLTFWLIKWRKKRRKSKNA